MDAKTAKRPVAYSAGAMILSLVPGEEKVALVFNKIGEEVKTIPHAHVARYNEGRVIEIRETDAIVTFTQRAGLGTPFGKEEPEDNGDRVVTSTRETLEETGSPIEDRIIPEISYTEKPDSWSDYFNVVFLADGSGFTFRRKEINDPFVEPRLSGFYPLRSLKLLYSRKKRGKKRQEKEHGLALQKQGLYQAALRRIMAILIQLDAPLLKTLGRPSAENAEDLIWALVEEIAYYNFFSYRMLKMFTTMQRPDIVLARLKNDKGKIRDHHLARHMGRNLITLMPDALMDEVLEALIARCDPQLLRGRQDLYVYLGKELQRKETPLQRVMLQHEAEKAEVGTDSEYVFRDERGDKPKEGLENYAKLWLAAELREEQERVAYEEMLKKKGGESR